MSPSRPRTRRPTLSDVASLAEVDVSTVSKVLSGARISVRPETRQRIVSVADELSYRPNASARSLSRRRTDMVGVLMPDFTNPIYAEMVRGAVARAEAIGYAALVAGLDGSDRAETYRRLIHEGRIDGLVVAVADADHVLLQRLENDGVPFIFMNRSIPGTDRNVTVDDASAVELSLTLLARLGHRHIGIIDASTDFDTAHRRAVAAERVTRQLGLPPPLYEEGLFSPHQAARATSRLLARSPRPTAIYCSNSFVTIGILSTLSEARLSVPDDMSIVSVEDPDVSALLVPALTTVRLPYEQLGSAAIDSLDLLMKARPTTDILLPVDPEPIVRGSTAPPSEPSV